MEEVIAKSAKNLYIITYSVCIFLSLVIAVTGALFIAAVDEAEAHIFGWVFIVLGIVLLAASIGWLIYFIKMPEAAIKLKDGKLYFRNGIVCSPTEVETFQSKGMGVDGAVFGFGRLVLSVNGKNFKLKFVKDAEDVTKKLFMLKAEYQIKENLAKQQLQSEQQAEVTEEVQPEREEN